MSSEYGPPRSKAELRQHLIERRRTLPPTVRRSSDVAIGQGVAQLCGQMRCQRLAAFVAHGGEPDLMPVLAKFHEIGHEIFLPVVRDQHMQFRRWQPDDDMVPNQFDIPEPVDGESLEPKALELVLLPLVGFAPDGARLGMGAGFYDRAFAFRRERIGWLPRLVGVAYSVQEVKALPIDDWDIPLDGVVTEQGLQWFK